MVQVKANASEKILGLPHIHPVALEIHAKELSFCGHLGEDLLLNGGGTGFDSLENRGVEDVDASIDLVGNEDLGLFHELLNLPLSVGPGHNHTILGRLIHLGHLQTQESEEEERKERRKDIEANCSKE